MANNTNTNNNSTNFVVEGISQEALAALLAQAGYTDAKVSAAPAAKKRVVDYIDYVDEDHKIGLCKACHKEFELASYTEEEIESAKKLGMCPECAAQYLK